MSPKSSANGLTDAEMHDLKRTLAENRNLGEVAAIVRTILQRTPPEKRLSLVAHICEAHPFFVPQFSEADRRALSTDLERYRQAMLSARITAAGIQAPRMLVACPPKSASSFIANALSVALDARHVSLSSTAYTARASSSLGANLREQEIDEAALLRQCLEPGGFVAQHHVRGAPYLSWLMEVHRCRVIVTTRNLFDSLVSFDDMLCKSRGPEPVPGHFFSDAMPGGYAQMPREERLEMLMEKWLFWYVQFYASWMKTSYLCALKPVWISYERDILAGNAHLAAKLAAEAPELAGKEERLLAALDQVGDGAARKNKGVAGRGATLPQALKDRAIRLIRRFEDDIDLSAMLAEPEANADAA